MFIKRQAQELRFMTQQKLHSIRSTGTATAILMSPDLPVFRGKVWLARLGREREREREKEREREREKLLTCWAISSTRLCFCWPIIKSGRSSWKLRSLLLPCLFCTPSLLQLTANTNRTNKHQQRTSMSTFRTVYSQGTRCL